MVKNKICTLDAFINTRIQHIKSIENKSVECTHHDEKKASHKWKTFSIKNRKIDPVTERSRRDINPKVFSPGNLPPYMLSPADPEIKKRLNQFMRA